jgi:hypothetical protein
MRDKEDQSATYDDGGEAEQKNIAIQLVEKFGGLIVRAEDAEADGSRLYSREFKRCR